MHHSSNMSFSHYLKTISNNRWVKPNEANNSSLKGTLIFPFTSPSRWQTKVLFWFHLEWFNAQGQFRTFFFLLIDKWGNNKKIRWLILNLLKERLKLTLISKNFAYLIGKIAIPIFFFSDSSGTMKSLLTFSLGCEFN